MAAAVSPAANASAALRPAISLARAARRQRFLCASAHRPVNVNPQVVHGGLYGPAPTCNGTDGGTDGGRLQKVVSSPTDEKKQVVTKQSTVEPVTISRKGLKPDLTHTPSSFQAIWVQA